ncbi:hypothetical protein AcW1_000638 [Taiwanofungus camphoratus]|nr:hypothetical protein AcW2_000868 [Antrodia cinnamomea]KAI0936382.1 hypothetical protein AcV5_004536 [Antrodia cinnamomea]KAI0961593.1 hypothetical protein AcV7_000655 [Antrodia cinnamomea]KAI0963605.1 hypothetical protein AcW1_000638 [Antrodia cinnamomea]
MSDRGGGTSEGHISSTSTTLCSGQLNNAIEPAELAIKIDQTSGHGQQISSPNILLGWRPRGSQTRPTAVKNPKPKPKPKPKLGNAKQVNDQEPI